VEFQSICVLGLGYIGLPTASTFATHGLQVVGVDVDQRVVTVLRNGEVHIHEPGLRTLVQAAFRSDNLKVSDEPETADAFVIAVPTPILDDKKADMRFVEAAAESIVPFLETGNLVVLESTSPPRTTVDSLAPILEQSGLTAGEDFYLAYTAERVLPGKILQELIENARVVGGVNRASAEAARDLYATFVRGEIHLTDATTAEMVKLMENTYRDINIAVANEFARLGEDFGIDIWQAIELANLHPRVDILRPGPGVGGHCISVDPWFLVEAAPETSQLIRQAREVNDAQPDYVVALVKKALGKLSGKTVAALGLAYKANVDDLRESPAVEVVERLIDAGAKVNTYEPFAPSAEVQGASGFQSLGAALKGADAILLLVDHGQFRNLEAEEAAGHMPGRIAIDTRGTWSKEAWEAEDFKVFTLGAGEA
jgi:UDP-N-acetyl-D-mannosaminuronic acid dehydrogenase